MTQIRNTPGKSIYLDGFIYEDGIPMGKCYLCPSPHPFVNNQEVVEGKDYVKEEQFWEGTAWWPVKHLIAGKSKPGTKTRIIAVPNDIQEGEKWFNKEDADKVQKDIDEVKAGMEIDRDKLFELLPISISDLKQLLFDVTQLCDGYRQDDTWSEWDESVRQRAFIFYKTITNQ